MREIGNLWSSLRYIQPLETPIEKCEKCSARPAGIEGHATLFTHRMTGSRVQFKCRACDLLWFRDQAADGSFEWSLSSGAFFGADMPGSQRPDR